MCAEGILLPGHNTSSFLRSSTGSTFDPVASIVSAVNLHQDCPSSLLRALADNHPDRSVWLQSYYEEKNSIESMGTIRKLTLGEYRALREKGAPRAIPSMCVLTIKKDENLLPIRAKSRIVVLGNHEDRIWSKSERFAPVLRSDSLRFLVSLAVEQRRILKQGDCKNAFCQSELPPDETTIVKPPSGDPDAQPGEHWLLLRTLYGLRRSPRHWYDKIQSVLTSLGLKQNPYDPCVFTGHLVDPDETSTSPSLDSDVPSDNQQPAAESPTPSSAPITLGLYVDDFVYFSADDAVEKKFERLLAKSLAVDFMGPVEWFLGIHFQWKSTPSAVSCHMNQAAFAANLVEQFEQHHKCPTPSATPYRSGMPIDAIAESTEEDDCLALIKRKQKYQSAVGSIGWLANSTRPDLAPIHSFLSSYNNRPALGHWKAVLYVLHYIHSTHDYGISFTSEDKNPIHTYLHFPDSSDTEAYHDAVAPTPSNSHKLTTYSDACWGSQIGNAVKDGVPLQLFKCRSMSGAIIFRSGGPISWKSVRQDKTSLSSCEAEIRATNEASKLTVGLRNLARGMTHLGRYPISDADSPTDVYNDNEACVKWSHNMTMKQTRHMEMRENAVREWVQDKTLSVHHVKGTCNPSDLFTKEMKDGVHFRKLRDSFMSRSSSFYKSPSSDPSLDSPGSSSNLVHLARAAKSITTSSSSGLLELVLSNDLFRTHSSVSHLSSAGRSILSKALSHQ